MLHCVVLIVTYRGSIATLYFLGYETCPADHARLYAGAGDHVRLYWADGLGHRRILADKGVVERAVGFVAEHLESSLLH